MAEKSIGIQQLPDMPGMDDSDQSTTDLLKKFEEGLGCSDSSDDEEFHDAQAEFLEEEARQQAEETNIRKCVNEPNITSPHEETNVNLTDPSDLDNMHVQSDDLVPSEVPVISETSGATKSLPTFCHLPATYSSLPSDSETNDNKTIDSSTSHDSCSPGSSVADDEYSNLPGVADEEPKIDVDELVQEAVEEAASVEDDPDEVIVDEEQILKDLEATWSEEEKEDKKAEAQELKASGNELFKQGCIEEAKEQYTAALALCPTCFPRERSIMYSNRAACTMRNEQYEDSIKDCTKALELNSGYLKCILRRAELHEKTQKLDEALADYQKVLEIDPSIISARQALSRLPDQIKERNEKLKEEMMGKLKDLGNMILKPFGLSTNSFNLNQDPNTGGYSVNFKS